MTSISSLQTLILDLPPSCISFCPSHPEYFVVGTYYLHPRPTTNSDNANSDGVGGWQEREDENTSTAAKRTGSLILFRLENDRISQVQTIESEHAILDIKWTPHADQLGPLLAVALSVEMFQLYKLQVDHGDATLVRHGDYFVGDTDDDLGMVLYIDWHPMKSDTLGFTMSNGGVFVCESHDGPLWIEGEAFYSVERAGKHELEAWTFAFVPGDSLAVLSGGDDAVLSFLGRDASDQIVKWQDKKLHGAGVTAVLPLTDELVLTGSYDDHIRLISFATGRRRTVEAELSLGGGVWRLQLLEPQHARKLVAAGSNSLVILASCMYAGSRAVRLRHVGNGGEPEDGGWVLDVLAKFEEHESMNYGSDVQPCKTDNNGGEVKSIVSTSFYDKRLCLWKIDISKLIESKDEEEERKQGTLVE